MENRVEPGFEIGARLEACLGPDRLEIGVLYEVTRRVAVPGETDGSAVETVHQRKRFIHEPHTIVRGRRRLTCEHGPPGARMWR